MQCRLYQICYSIAVEFSLRQQLLVVGICRRKSVAEIYAMWIDGIWLRWVNWILYTSDQCPMPLLVWILQWNCIWNGERERERKVENVYKFEWNLLLKVIKTCVTCCWAIRSIALNGMKHFQWDLFHQCLTVQYSGILWTQNVSD